MLHKIFSHRTSYIRSNILNHRRRRNRSIDHSRIFHCSFLSEHFNGSSDFWIFLSNRNINTVDILSFLIEDRIGRNGRLSRLSISNNQFSLPSSNWHHRINRFNSCFQRHIYWLSCNYSRSYFFHKSKMLWSDSLSSVDRFPNSVEHSSQVFFSYSNTEDLTRRTHTVSLLKRTIISEHEDSNSIGRKIQN